MSSCQQSLFHETATRFGKANFVDHRYLIRHRYTHQALSQEFQKRYQVAPSKGGMLIEVELPLRVDYARSLEEAV
jgi:hypothetical protein